MLGMSTATVTPLPHRDDDAVISATVAALISGRHLRREDVAASVGMSKTTMYNKLNGTAPWKAAEVSDLARYFGVTIQALYDGLSGTFPGPGAPVTSGWSRRRTGRTVALRSWEHRTGVTPLAA